MLLQVRAVLPTRHAVHGQAGATAKAAVPLGGSLALIAHHVLGILPALPLHGHCLNSHLPSVIGPQNTSTLARNSHMLSYGLSCVGGVPSRCKRVFILDHEVFL